LSEQGKLNLVLKEMEIIMTVVEVIEAFEYQIRIKQLSLLCFFD